MAEDDLLDSIASGDTIDDFLVSLASGLAEAQKKLYDISQSTGSGVMYQIPKLEFELKLQISTSKQQLAGPTGRGRGGRQIMRVATPVGKEETVAASTLKGTLVAVPINSGQPRYSMDISFSEHEQSRQLEVFVSMQDVAGAPQSGVEVQVNIDRDESYELNKENSLDQKLHQQTVLKEGVIITNKQGVASTILQIHETEKAGMLVVITADSLGESKALNYRIS